METNQPLTVQQLSAQGQLTKQQLGWLKMAEKRVEVTAELEKQKLSVMETLSDFVSKPLEEKQAAIKKAKAQLNALIDHRKEFTGFIEERLITPMRQYEKDTDIEVSRCVNLELQDRKEEEARLTKAKIYHAERLALKAHIGNELARIENVMVNAAEYAATSAISHCLIEEKSLLDARREAIAAAKAACVPSPLRKFPLVTVSVEEASEIFSSFPPINKDVIFESVLSIIDDKLATYTIDIKRGKDASEELAQEAKERAEEREKKLSEQSAVNTIVAASAATIVTPKSSTVKSSYAAEMLIDDALWGARVCSLFAKDFQTMTSFLRTKSIDKITIGQMADAIVKYESETAKTEKDFSIPVIKKEK